LDDARIIELVEAPHHHDREAARLDLCGIAESKEAGPVSTAQRFASRTFFFHSSLTAYLIFSV
jgi:hypothetical protein